MSHKKVFLVILAFSACLTILGFIIDSDEYVPDLLVNSFEFIVMTAILSAFFFLLYLMGFFLVKWAVKK